MTLSVLPAAAGRKKSGWLSVGLKMMIGVGVVSNLCIGLIMYVNFTMFSQVESRTSALIEIYASMNSHLRSGIFELQTKILEIPELLATDTTEQIFDWIRQIFPVEKDDVIKGSDQYRELFDRTQRRDLLNRRIIIQPENGGIVISKGIFDEKGTFSDAVSRIYLKTDNAEQDIRKLQAYMVSAGKITDSEGSLKDKVAALKALLTDEAITAETSRNEILYQVENIQNQQAGLIQYRQEKLKTLGFMAILAIVINLGMLHLMAWFIVELPLKQLTQSLEKINRGEPDQIPFQNRKDRIGILAGALRNFQTVLAALRKEDQRKKAEQAIIQELIQKMSGMISSLQKKASVMKDTAGELNMLAADTEDQTCRATQAASKTVEQTDTIVLSTHSLQSAVTQISGQVSRQNELISDINDTLGVSKKDIHELTRASEQISDIVHIVKNIAGETRLLALNARIEAARSGEAGKGFAVVAGEVRTLSIQTETANEDISARIEAIQATSRAIIENTHKIEARIEKLMATRLEISSAVEEQTRVTGGISRNIDATTHDIKEVSDRICKLQQSSQFTSRFAGTVQSHSEEIAENLSQLFLETREKLSMIGFSEEAQEKPVEGINDYPRKNAA